MCGAVLSLELIEEKQTKMKIYVHILQLILDITYSAKKKTSTLLP